MRCKHSPFGNRNGFAFAVADQKDERFDCCRNIPSLDFFCDRSFASKQLNDVGLLHTSDLSLIGRILENLIVVAVAEIAIIMATANYIKEALKCKNIICRNCSLQRSQIDSLPECGEQCCPVRGQHTTVCCPNDWTYWGAGRNRRQQDWR
jgi:hypothetical protein